MFQSAPRRYARGKAAAIGAAAEAQRFNPPPADMRGERRRWRMVRDALKVSIRPPQICEGKDNRHAGDAGGHRVSIRPPQICEGKGVNVMQISFGTQFQSAPRRYARGK